MKPWTDLQEVGDGDHRRLLVRRHFVAAHRKLLHERGVVVDEMACGCCWEQLHGGFSAGRWIDRSCGCRGSGLVGCCNKGAAPWSAPRHRCAHPAARGARCGPSHSRGAQLALRYHGVQGTVRFAKLCHLHHRIPPVWEPVSSMAFASESHLIRSAVAPTGLLHHQHVALG